MNYTGVVRGFCEYNPSQREQLKKDLSLSFSEELLAFCMAHYKTAEKRDPYIDELQMLSALAVSLEKDCSAMQVTELFTNDSSLADTYADLLKKRKALHPNATSPASLRELSTVAARYLFSVKGRPSHAPRLSYPEYLHDLPVSPSAFCASPSDSPFRLRFGSAPAASAEMGDILVLLTRSEADTVYRYARKCERFFDLEAVNARISGIYPVGDAGLLRELLEISGALVIDLRAFSPRDLSLPVTVLTDSFTGCRILRVNAVDLSPLLTLMREHGMCGFPFAQITSDEKYTFVRKKGDAFSIQTRFLCTLFERKPISVKLPDEESSAAESVIHRATNVTSCAYLAKNAGSDSKTVSVGGLTCSAAFTSPKTSFFKSAILSAVAPMLSLALSGKDHTDVSVCHALEIPLALEDPLIAGECLSLLLGVYRVQTELSLVSSQCILRSHDVAHPTLSSFVYGEAAAHRFRLSVENATVYCLSLPMAENGIPDFSALRALLRELSQLARDGAIASARVLINESITSGLIAMQGAYKAKLTDTAIASECALSAAILVESHRELPYRPVAITVRAPLTPPCDPTLPPLQSALFWTGKPVVTLLAREYDHDAAALSSLLSHRGATVRPFSPTRENALDVAQALLSSQLFILCKETALPKDARMEAALAFFKQSGGSVLSFEEAEILGATVLENGISEALLDSFFKNS